MLKWLPWFLGSICHLSMLQYKSVKLAALGPLKQKHNLYESGIQGESLWLCNKCLSCVQKVLDSSPVLASSISNSKGAGSR